MFLQLYDNNKEYFWGLTSYYTYSQSRSVTCCFSFLEVTTISPTYACTFRLSIGAMILSIKH